MAPGALSAPSAEMVAQPLYESVLQWTSEHLAPWGYGRPLCKRLALLLVGLLAAERATLSDLTTRVYGLQVSPAREPSILRRLTRLLDDGRLDPARLLPDVLGRLLAVGLGPTLAAAPPRAARDRTPWVRLIVDETSVANRLHVLVVGLALPGLVLPLALRCWRQNAPLPPGQYWAELSSACWQVQALLPAAVRGHVLLLADRAYGVPQVIDLCRQLGWAYAVRVQGAVHVRLQRQSASRALRTLVPRPGTSWYGGWTLAALSLPDATPGAAAPVVFKKAGWRPCQVVAAWAVGQPEPWLVLTDLPGTPAALQEYARRWAIERLFLAWKAHGWDLETCGLTDPTRLTHLLTGLALATWWRLAMALPRVLPELAHLAAGAAPPCLVQLRLPWDATPPPPRQPWLAKFSLLSWGAKVAHSTPFRTHTPALRWPLPPWSNPSWAALCAQVARTHALP